MRSFQIDFNDAIRSIGDMIESFSSPLIHSLTREKQESLIRKSHGPENNPEK